MPPPRSCNVTSAPAWRTAQPRASMSAKAAIIHDCFKMVRRDAKAVIASDDVQGALLTALLTEVLHRRTCQARYACVQVPHDHSLPTCGRMRRPVAKKKGNINASLLCVPRKIEKKSQALLEILPMMHLLCDETSNCTEKYINRFTDPSKALMVGHARRPRRARKAHLSMLGKDTQTALISK